MENALKRANKILGTNYKDWETFERANRILGTKYEDWETLSEHRGLTEDFIREFQFLVDWDTISKYQRLSEEFIREFKNRVDWCSISQFQPLSEDFIREFTDRVDWEGISANQHLSEDFIREFEDKVDWACISTYQHLSEDFIRNFLNCVDWRLVSCYQHLSEDFIREFKDWVDWRYIYKYQRLSKEFIEEMGLLADSWHYKSTEEKKKAVMDTGLYECHNDYFIAYKGIRSDRYSAYNFQYQYLKGHTYETWCDCSADNDSYGFSAWTEEEAREYCNELIVRVKVRYEDVGRVVHDGGKIRCFKMEILD